MTPCNCPAPAYNAARSLRTSLKAEPRTRQNCGFFVPALQANSACYPVSMPDGVPGNTQYPEPSLSGSEPPSGAHSFGFQFSAEEETDMSPPQDLAPTLQETLEDARSALDQIAISLDFIAEGMEHQGARHLLIHLSNQVCCLEDQLLKLVNKEGEE